MHQECHWRYQRTVSWWPRFNDIPSTPQLESQPPRANRALLSCPVNLLCRSVDVDLYWLSPQSPLHRLWSVWKLDANNPYLTVQQCLSNFFSNFRTYGRQTYSLKVLERLKTYKSLGLKVQRTSGRSLIGETSNLCVGQFAKFGDSLQHPVNWESWGLSRLFKVCKRVSLCIICSVVIIIIILSPKHNIRLAKNKNWQINVIRFER